MIKREGAIMAQNSVKENNERTLLATQISVKKWLKWREK